LTKRFFRRAEVAECGAGFTVALDGRPIRTPEKAAVVLPTRPLAAALAEEWQGQGEEIEPESLRLTRLANTAIDRVSKARPALVAEIVAFGGTDLVCYRAEGPPELVRRQEAAWRPLIAWIAGHYEVRLTVTEGVVPVAQPAEAAAAFHAAVAPLDDMALAALYAAVAACGSLVLGLALLEGRITPEEALELSLIDERFQAESWGANLIFARRCEALGADITAAARFMGLSRP
jgi:chaperone required for assembly of F1-ATPase